MAANIPMESAANEGPAASATPAGVAIVYDGECPFCSRYVALLRLREAVGRVRLIDARTDQALVNDLRRQGLDLNEGMLVTVGGRNYYGADAVNVLALMSSRAGLMNRLAAWSFRTPLRARLLYPVVRAGRNATLRLLGREKL
jgi:predicted DCC family thiol-disulfide oxidoreductase YuxK